MIHEKLLKIQSSLSAPKNQRNSFGGYNYRSCEDILEALKPHLAATKTIINLSDDVRIVGDRIYVQSTATLTDTEDGSFITATAFARESLTKKGMDDSQITGTASSYARKYALNGLLAIDDNKDADTDAFAKTTKENAATAEAPKPSKKPASPAPAPGPKTIVAYTNMNDLPF